MRRPKPPRWEYLHLGVPSGYAEAAYRTMAALEASGITISSVPFVAGSRWGHWFEPVDRRWARRRPADVVVAHVMPEYYPHVVEARPDAFVIGHTAWEADRLPGDWVARLELVDLIVVPCQMNADVIREEGVTTPVVVIPHPVASTPARPDGLASELVGSDAVTTIYVIAEWTVRKGVTDAVRAFARAFGPDDGVRMVVKTTRVDMTTAARPKHPLDEGTSAYALGRVLAEVPDPPPVTLITRTLDGGEVAALHAAGDCYVSLCRGEGWGIGAFDAATLGTPVVTTGWGGHLDYLGDSSLLVRYELVDVDHGPGLDIDGRGQRWARPDLEHAVELLRAVVADPGGHRDERAEIARGIAESCSPDAVAERWHAAIASADAG